ILAVAVAWVVAAPPARDAIAQDPAPTPISRDLPPSAEKAYRALSTRFDTAGALDVVRFMDQYWRLAGNPGFDASIDHIRDRLVAAGFAATTGTATARVRVDEVPNAGRGWDYRVGTLQIDGEAESLLSRDRDRVSLAINSFSTSPGGLVAPLVDVGGGSTSDYAGKEIKGAVVLGDAPLGRLWQEAVRRRGAAGVVSTEIARYIR